jgi:hypothetical protein
MRSRKALTQQESTRVKTNKNKRTKDNTKK